jgi:hypothetical protein
MQKERPDPIVGAVKRRPKPYKLLMKPRAIAKEEILKMASLKR